MEKTKTGPGHPGMYVPQFETRGLFPEFLLCAIRGHKFKMYPNRYLIVCTRCDKIINFRYEHDHYDNQVGN